MSFIDDLLNGAKTWLPDVPDMVTPTRRAAAPAVDAYLGDKSPPLVGPELKEYNQAIADALPKTETPWNRKLGEVLDAVGYGVGAYQGNEGFVRAKTGHLLSDQRIADSTADANKLRDSQLGMAGDYIKSKIADRQDAQKKARAIIAAAVSQYPAGPERDAYIKEARTLAKQYGVMGIDKDIADAVGSAPPSATDGAPAAVPAQAVAPPAAAPVGPGSPAGIPPAMATPPGGAPAPAPAQTPPPGPAGDNGVAPDITGPAPVTQALQAGVAGTGDSVRLRAEAAALGRKAMMEKTAGRDGSIYEKQAEDKVKQADLLESAGPQALAKASADKQVEAIADRPHQEMMLSDIDQKYEMQKEIFDRLIDKKGALTEGARANYGWDSLTYNSPTGAAADRWADIQQLGDIAKFIALQSLKASSKTGGGAGNMTEKEWPIFENQIANLTNKQSPERAAQQIKAVRDKVEQMWKAQHKQFDDTYGSKRTSVDNQDETTQEIDGVQYAKRNGKWFKK